MNKIKKVCVVGSGTMGNGIAHCAAQHYVNTTLIDIDDSQLEKAKIIVSENLDRQLKKNIISITDKENIMSRINFSSDLKDCSSAEIVIEAVPEKFKLKAKLFKDLSEFCSNETIFASNTSSISITKLSKYVKKRENLIGMHFMNPVPVMKLVEVINTKFTSKATTQRVIGLSKSMNKSPVECKDSPGFISNRILMPMINEAILCLQNEIANAEAIDKIMKLGMSHPMGPLQLADFIGLDVCLDIMNVLYDGFKDNKYKPCSLLIKMVDDGFLGKKTGYGFYKY